MRSIRPQRLADLIQAEMAQILRQELNDPRVGQVSITHVEVTRDLRVARLTVTPFGGLGDATKMLKGLTAANGYIRRLMGKRLKLRHTPELEWRLDDHTDKAVAMTSMLMRMERERAVQDGDGEE
jgi:ribosome-binding factor A